MIYYLFNKSNKICCYADEMILMNYQYHIEKIKYNFICINILIYN